MRVIHSVSFTMSFSELVSIPERWRVPEVPWKRHRYGGSFIVLSVGIRVLPRVCLPAPRRIRTTSHLARCPSVEKRQNAYQLSIETSLPHLRPEHQFTPLLLSALATLGGFVVYPVRGKTYSMSAALKERASNGVYIQNLAVSPPSICSTWNYFHI